MTSTAAFVRRHFRYNLVNIAVVHGVWQFGAAMASREAILPVFLSRLGASEFALGLLPAAFMLAMTVPQLFAAHVTRRLPIKKVFFTSTHYPGTVGLLVLGLLAWRLEAVGPQTLVVATFIWLAIYGLSVSFAMPMWVNLQAKLYPDNRRGRGFSYVSLTGSVCGAAGSLCAARMLEVLPFPRGFAVPFVIGGALLSLFITWHYWLREPAVEPDEEKVDFGGFLREVASALRASPCFAWLLVASFVGALSSMAAAFYAVAGVERFDLPMAAAGQFGAVLIGGRVVGSLIAGQLGDRVGFKSVALLAPVADAAACLLALMAPTAAWHYVVFAFLGVRATCAMIGMHNLAIEFCPTSDKTTFIAMTSTALCPAYLLGPLCGGLLASYHPARYEAVFVAAAVCSVIALVVLAAKVRDPRSAA